AAVAGGPALDVGVMRVGRVVDPHPAAPSVQHPDGAHLGGALVDTAHDDAVPGERGGARGPDEQLLDHVRGVGGGGRLAAEVAAGVVDHPAVHDLPLAAHAAARDDDLVQR